MVGHISCGERRSWSRRDMLDSNSNTAPPNKRPDWLFSSIFDQSRIPMALLDRDRRYVKVNDALVNFYEYPRSELLGRIADSMVVDDTGGIGTRWEQLVRTNQLY